MWGISKGGREAVRKGGRKGTHILYVHYNKYIYTYIYIYIYMCYFRVFKYFYLFLYMYIYIYVLYIFLYIFIYIYIFFFYIFIYLIATCTQAVPGTYLHVHNLHTRNWDCRHNQLMLARWYPDNVTNGSSHAPTWPLTGLCIKNGAAWAKMATDNILGICFRSSPSLTKPRIPLLTVEYEGPHDCFVI